MNKKVSAIIVLVVVLVGITVYFALSKNAISPVIVAQQIIRPAGYNIAFEEAINKADFTDIGNYFADKVFVGLEGSSCCGEVDVSRAVFQELERIKGLTFTFNPNDNVVKEYIANIVSQYPNRRLMKNSPPSYFDEYVIGVESDIAQKNPAVIGYKISNGKIVELFIDVERDENNSTKNWETYTSEKYGFEVKYPANLSISLGNPAGITFIGFYNSSRKEFFDVAIFNAQDLVMESYGRDWENQGEIVVGGYKTRKFSRSISDGPNTNAYLIPDKNIAINFPNPDTIFTNQILSTFKFTESVITYNEFGKLSVVGDSWFLTARKHNVQTDSWSENAPVKLIINTNSLCNSVSKKNVNCIDFNIQDGVDVTVEGIKNSEGVLVKKLTIIQ